MLCVPRMLKGKVWEAAVKATVLIVIWQNGDLPLSPSATENGEESRKCETVPVFPDPTMFSSNFYHHHHPFDNNQLIAFKLKISTTTLWVSLWCNAVSWKVIICLSYQKADLHSSIYLRRQNNKKRPAEKLFSVSLTFVNTTKKIKGIPLWVYIPSIPCLYLPFFVLLCSKLPEKLSTNPFFVLLLNAEINSHLAFFTDARGFSLCLQMYWFIYQCHTRPVLSNINMKHNNSE